MRSNKICRHCKHELTECAVGSIGHDNECCLTCTGVARRIGQCVYGGTKCQQVDHDVESVEHNLMTEQEFYLRNPKAVKIVTFEQVQS